jgi:hypothetical protein
MAKGEKKQVAGANETKSGYWLYDDGLSYWGTNNYRFGKLGIEVTEEIHKKKTVEEKIQYFKDNPPKPKVVVEEEHRKEKK